MNQQACDSTGMMIGRRQILATSVSMVAGSVLGACAPSLLNGTPDDTTQLVSPTPSLMLSATDVTAFPIGGSRVAPDFMFEAYQGVGVIGSERVQFREILAAGTPVVLNFWASQCPPCRAEMLDLQQVYGALHDRVLLMGLDIGPLVGLGSSDEGRALAGELGVTYPLGTTHEADILQRFWVLGIPTTVFITPDAEIVRQWTGVVDASSMMKLVDELVAVS